MRIYKTFLSPTPALTFIKKISLIQFRNYPSATYEFTYPVMCIAGRNGSGKTNLLDAIYYLCYTKSYFTSMQQNTAMAGTDGFRVTGIFEGKENDDTVSCKWKAGKKEIQRNNIDYEKVTDHIGTWSAVMIAPDDIELINEHSELRRKWIDGILGQADRKYLEELISYQRILQQRNAWLRGESLKPGGNFTELEYYNARMAVGGTYIYQKRAAFLESFLPMLANFYHQLSGGNEPVSVRYISDLTQKPMLDWLQHGLDHDLRYQRTLKGIHKDDWELGLNGMALKQFGSQGQKKSFLFALKLAQYTWLTQTLGHKPILLLDDIFEKLDQTRMEALLKIIRGDGFGQVVLTDTHPDRIKSTFGPDAPVGYIYL